MRLIKFRAWTGSQMRKVDHLHFRSDHVSVGFGNYSEDIYSEKTEPRLTLMQFTGLLDKNGKEIYEGDLILDIEDRNKIANQVIFGESGYPAFEVYPACDESDCNYLQVLVEEGACEVIGNIYENLELLK